MVVMENGAEAMLAVPECVHVCVVVGQKLEARGGSSWGQGPAASNVVGWLARFRGKALSEVGDRGFQALRKADLRRPAELGVGQEIGRAHV